MAHDQFVPDDSAIPQGVPIEVFLVENHDDTRTALTWFLEDLGCHVISARNAEEAVATFPTTKSLDVFISDISLPDGDGWKLIGQLNVPTSTLKVALSGHGSEADVEKSRAAGYDHHLLKPAVVDKLQEIVRTRSEG